MAKTTYFLAEQSKQYRVGKIRPIDPSHSCSQSDHRIRLRTELKLACLAGGIGYFRVPKTLTSKTRLGAKPLS